MTPSFSIVVETSNLAGAELDSLGECLASLDRQTIGIGQADDVSILSGGEAPPAELERLRARFPWLSVRALEPNMRYGDVKAIGGEHVTSEVVVLCDADVRYEPDWLEQLLAPFAREEVQIASGETTTPVRGPYSLAIALAFSFPRFSGEREPSPAHFYWANNVAFRRSFVEQIPMPQGLPIFRGQTIIHSRALLAAGHTIWRVPLARSVHDLPTLREVLPRFMLKGYDSLRISQLVEDPSGRSYMGGMEPGPGSSGRWESTRRRIVTVFGEDPRRVLLVPFALPPFALILGAYFLGRARARLRWAPREARPADRGSPSPAGL